MMRRAVGRIRGWAALAILAAGLLAAPGVAQAAWRRAETDRFIVYGEGSEQRVRDYTTKLMTFDRVLRMFHPSTLNKVPATKLTVYLVDQRSDIRKVQPGLVKEIAGFYVAMNEGVFAVAMDERAAGADDVMFHEYAHHFMLENFPAAYPAWFVEGFAEYFMTAEIAPKTVKVGGYSPQRAYAIFNRNWLPLEEVIGRTTAETRPERLDVFYAEAWLLTHYMRSSPDRARQMDQATKAISAGEEPVKALQDATGMDMDQLTKALKGYHKLQLLGLKNPYPEPPPMTVTQMPKSADDLLLADLRLILSTTGRVDQAFLDDVRARAAKYPGDLFAERTLARAEFVMGDVAAGRALMQHRLAEAPEDREALILAGTGELMAGMRAADQRVERFRASRPYFGKAYQLDKSDFRPLYAYGVARSIEPDFPSDNDMQALLEARTLAPSVMENSLRAGLALLRRGDPKRAAVILAPVINNPHAGRAGAQARALLAGGKVSEAELEGAGDDDEGDAPPAKP